jgi:hypothetical protein
MLIQYLLMGGKIAGGRNQEQKNQDARARNGDKKACNTNQDKIAPNSQRLIFSLLMSWLLIPALPPSVYFNFSVIALPS